MNPMVLRQRQCGKPTITTRPRMPSSCGNGICRKELPLKIANISVYNVGDAVSVPCPLFLQNDEENLVLQQVKYAKKKRRGINMRKYQENGMLESVVCNGCGKKLVVERGILREGGFAVNYPWDYFSEKDGEIHHWDLCEDCYDSLIHQFVIAPEIEEAVEFM